MRGRRLRLAAALAVAGLVMAFAPLSAERAVAAPPDVVADNPAEYALCGRVFPDPMAYAPSPAAAPGESPYAKGNAVCRAADFLSHDASLRGLHFLEELFPRFVEVIDLTDPRFDEILDRELGDGQTAGLQNEFLERDKSNLTMVKVTDADSPIAEGDREHFVFPLSIHGIERAGIEGGLRAVEDLATWAAQEPDRPIMETIDNPEDLPEGTRNLPVGEVLQESVSYFLLANPDGWRRGDTDNGGAGFMRYNGNGVDLNREWPTMGYTELDYTPWSEPETRSFGKVLKSIKPKWSGGIDLHGQILDRAFSFTLIGGGQRPFDKNERVMQFVEQAYSDASTRLSWSKIVKPNDAFQGCVDSNNVNPDFNPPPCDPRVYGVQYGTIWDSISYTVTGDFGGWIDSPLGLDADGIDNEMSLSHLGNCGNGKCYLAEAEQLHVDGNKSLIYAMLNFQMQPPEANFTFDGTAAYLYDDRRLQDEGTPAPTPPPGTRPQSDITQVVNHQGGTSTLEFDVKGPDEGFYNGGITGQIDVSNVRGISQGLHSAAIERQDPETGQWQRMGSGFGTGLGYNPAGQRVEINYPEPGRYRLVASGITPTQIYMQVRFTTAPAWPDPVQAPFDVSPMDFFDDLEPFVADGQLVAVSADELLSGAVDLTTFDSVLAIDDALLPGFEPTSDTKATLPSNGYTAADRDAIAQQLRAFAEGGGNVVLTDDSVRAVSWMGLIDASAIDSREVYAGHVGFTLDGTDTTYDDPLAENMNPPGSSEGPGRRKQTTEPVPLGYSLGGGGQMPQWYVDRDAWEAAGGRTVGLEGPCPGINSCIPGRPSSQATRTTLGELPVGAGQVRILGSLLPWPTTEFPHNYGLRSYSVTFNGYELTKNLLSHERGQ